MRIRTEHMQYCCTIRTEVYMGTAGVRPAQQLTTMHEARAPRTPPIAACPAAQALVRGGTVRAASERWPVSAALERTMLARGIAVPASVVPGRHPCR